MKKRLNNKNGLSIKDAQSLLKNCGIKGRKNIFGTAPYKNNFIVRFRVGEKSYNAICSRKEFVGFLSDSSIKSFVKPAANAFVSSFKQKLKTQA